MECITGKWLQMTYQKCFYLVAACVKSLPALLRRDLYKPGKIWVLAFFNAWRIVTNLFEYLCITYCDNFCC